MYLFVWAFCIHMLVDWAIFLFVFKQSQEIDSSTYALRLDFFLFLFVLEFYQNICSNEYDLRLRLYKFSFLSILLYYVVVLVFFVWYLDIDTSHIFYYAAWMPMLYKEIEFGLVLFSSPIFDVYWVKSIEDDDPYILLRSISSNFFNKKLFLYFPLKLSKILNDYAYIYRRFI